MDAGALDDLRSIVGPENLIVDEEELRHYARDASPMTGQVPTAAVRPSSIEEVQGIVRWANRTGTPLYVRSCGTSLWGAVPVRKDSVVVDMRRMNRVVAVDEGSLSVRVEPGITFFELERELASRGLSVMVEPENWHGCVGGNFSSHGSGWGTGPNMANQAEAVLGLKVVLPDGSLLTTGSMASPWSGRQFYRYSLANDLTGLFAGSEGTLGIIVELALRVEEAPGGVGLAVYTFDDLGDAADALYRIRRVRIPTIYAYLAAGWTLDILYPEKAPWSHRLRVIVAAPTEDQVRMEMGRLDAIAGARGKYQGPAEAERLVKEKDAWVREFAYKAGMRAALMVHVPLGSLGDYLRKFESLAAHVREVYGLRMGVGGFLTDRSFVSVIAIYFDPRDSDSRSRAIAAWNDVKVRALESGAVPYRIGGIWADQMPRMGEYYDFLRRLKSTLDPMGIMSPGILGL
ncbi:FAD-binding oxidoreductase [Conexivisphaera calida]|uniref:D-lactate dehydrogenase (cytochrome) n=1 Tax=Conexivisphaera calida TaxID=1874277 RepID=A0A4P2VCX9_9ARCH|nr:FAD-binding oxidoreductase [Conexivisphaera calida]BBE42394.1 Glycolate dehydrogenase [Conexivisphaera calida]